MDFCNSSDGTNLVIYDTYRSIMIALNSACTLYKYILKAYCHTMYFVLGDEIVIPILVNDEIGITIPEEKRFWGIRITLFKDNPFFEFALPDLPLPKQSINDLWRDFIAPHDYYIPGSEYGFYRDPSTGDIKLGIEFTPIKQFGLFANLPTIFKDITIIGIIAKVFIALGLGKIASAFLTSLRVSMQNKKFMDKFNDIEHDIEELQTQQTDTNIDLTSLKDGQQHIIDLMGVRLLLR